MNISYSPELPDDSYTVLNAPDLHLWDELLNGRSPYSVAEDLNRYAEEFGVDEVDFLGDTGPMENVEALLENLENVEKVKIVAGDEDKSKNYGEAGWFRTMTSWEPFDVDVDYEVFNEGFEEEILGNGVQMAHHPADIERDWKRNGFFTVDWYGNNSSYTNPPHSMDNGNTVFVHAHNHADYARAIGENVVIGGGSGYHNYDMADGMPERSLGILAFQEDALEYMHIDYSEDEVFEHLRFRLDPVVGMEDLKGDRVPAELRFDRNKFPDKAHESPVTRPIAGD